MKLGFSTVKSLVMVLVGAAILAGAATGAQAANITWNGTASGNWTTVGNWVGGVPPANNATQDIALFDNSSYTNQPIVDAARSVGGLTLTSNSADVTINVTGGAFTVGTTGNVSTGISLAAGKTLTFTGNQAINLNGPIVETGASANLTISSTGTTTLAGTNTYTGTTTLTAGTLALAATGSLSSSSALTFGGTSTFNRTSPAVGSIQSLGTLSFNAGEGTVQSTYGTSGNAGLTFSSLAARASGAVGNFIVSGGTNGTTNKIVLTGQSTGFINQGIFFGGSYAWYDSGGFVRAINYGVDANTFTTGTTASISSNNNVQATGAITAQNTATFLTLASSANITLATGATVTTNGILKVGGNAATLTGGNGVQAANNAELVIRTDVAGDSLTISTPILANGTNALTKAGLGTLVLSAANTYTGNTTLNAGTLNINNITALGTSAGTLIINGGSLNNNSGNAVTLINNNPQQWNADFTFTGANDLNLGTGAVTLNANRQVTVSAGILTVGGAIGGSGYGLIKAGVGTLQLNGTNTYSGATTVNSGILKISGGAAIADATPVIINGAPAILDLNGSSETVGAVTLTAGTIQNGTLTGSSYAVSAGLIDGNLGNSAATLTKSTTGLAILTGNNAYSGGTVVTGGQLRMGNAGALGSGNLTLNGGVLELQNPSSFTLSLGTTAGTVQLPGGVSGFSAKTNAATINLGGAGATLQWGGDAAFSPTTLVLNDTTADAGLTLQNGLDLNGGNRTINVNANTATISGVISDFSGTGNLVKGGAGVLVLSNANTYAGTIVTGGQLRLNNASALGSGSLTLNGGVLELQNPSSLILPLGTTAGTVQLPGGASGFSAKTNAATINLGNAGATLLWGGATFNPSTLVLNDTTADAGLTLQNGLDLNNATRTINVNANTATISGVISSTGTGSLTKGGAGTLVLSNTNTYNGTTTVTNGMLQLSGGTAILDTAAVTVNGATATLDLNGGSETVGAVTLTNGTIQNGTLTGSSYAVAAGLISGNLGNSAATLTKSSTGLVILSGSNAYTGNTVVTGGQLRLNNASALGSGNLTLNGGVLELQNPSSFTLSLGTTAGTVQLSGGASGFSAKTNAATINLGNAGATLQWGGATFNPTTLILNDTTADAGLTLQNGLDLNGATRTINVNANTATISGVISDSLGTGNLVKGGAGVLVLSNANTYAGNTTLSAGQLNLNNAAALGTSAGTFMIGAGTTIDNTSGASITLANNNPQRWNGDFTFTGTNSLNLGTGTVTMNATRTVTVANNTLTVGGAISGATFGLTKAGAGALSLNGANLYTGNTTLNAGTLNINNTAALGTSAGNLVIGPGTFIDNTSGGDIALANNNPQRWNGDFTFNGTNSLNLGTGTVTMNATRTVTVVNNILTVGGAISGATFGLTKNGIGTLSLNGTNTYSGNTTINGGVLMLNAAAALPGGINATGGTSGLTFVGQNYPMGMSGVVGLGNGDFLRGLGTGVTQVQWTGSGGFAAYGADRVVNISNNSVALTWGSGNFVVGALILGASSATNKVTFQNPIDLNAATRVVQVDDGAANIDATFNGIISGATGSLIKTGTGTLSMNASNTYAGTTQINGGQLIINAGAGGALNTSSVLNFNFGNYNYGVSSNTGGTFNYDNTTAAGAKAQTLAGLVLTTGEGTVQLTRTAAQTVTLTANSSLIRYPGAVAYFNYAGTTGNLGTDSKIVLAGQNAGFISQGAFFGSGNYAWYDSAGFVRALNYGTDPGTFTTGTTATISNNNNVQTTGAITAQQTATFLTLNLAAGTGSFTLDPAQTVTVNGLLKTGNDSATITGGTGLQPATNADLIIRTEQAGDTLVLSTPLLANGVNPLVKTGAGTLRLGTANSLPSAPVTVYNGTLDLNNNNTTIGSLAGGGAVTLGSANLTLAGPTNGQFTGTLSGTGNVFLTGKGLLYLNNNNSGLSGNIALSNGFLKADTNANALGAGTLALNGGELILNGSIGLSYNRNTTVSGNTIIYLDRGLTVGAGVTNTLGTLGISGQMLVIGGGATTSLNAGLTFGATTLTGNTNLYVRNYTTTAGNTLLTLGGITGTGNLIATGTGIITLTANLGNTGSFTTYNTGTINLGAGISSNSTGNFTQYAGTIQADPTSSIASTGAIKLLGGTLAFGTGSGQVHVLHFTGNAALTMGGGSLAIQALNSGILTNNFSAFNLLPGTSRIMTGGSSGGTQMLVFPSLTSRAVGSTAIFPATGYSGGVQVQFTSPPALTGNLIGGWAAIGQSFVSVNASGNIVAAPFESTNVNTAIPTYNVDQSLLGGVTLSANTTINSLRLSGDVSPYALDLNQKTLTLTTGGLMTNITIASSRLAITNGTLTSGGSELFILGQGSNGNNNHNFMVSATIADNGGPVNLVRGGDTLGVGLYLSGENTYSGKTVLATGSNVAGSLVNFMTERQFGAYPTSGTPVADKMILNNINLQDTVNVPFTWASVRGITLAGGGGATITHYTGFNAAVIPAPITGTGSLTFASANNGSELLLTGASTFDGQINNAGLGSGGSGSGLDFTSIGNIGDPTPTAMGAPTTKATGLVVQSANSGSLSYVGAGASTTDRDFMPNLSDTRFRANGAGPLTINGNFYLPSISWSTSYTTGTGNRFLGVGVGIINGNILEMDSSKPAHFLQDLGANFWRLTGQNTFSGFVKTSSGILEFTTVGNVGAGPSSLGSPTGNPTLTANTQLVLSGGTMRFMGDTNQSTDRTVLLTASGGLESSSLTGASLTILGNITNTGAATLTLGGTGSGYISGAAAGTTGLNNGAGITSVTKAGFGTWTINTATVNTYTGATSVNGGTLVLDYSNLGTPTNLINSTSALTLGGGNLNLVGKSGSATAQTLGAVTLTAGTGSQLSLNANGAPSLTLTTGVWTRNTGSTLNASTSGSTTLTASAQPTLANNLYPWMTLGMDFATTTGSGPYTFTAATYNGTLPTATGNAGLNYTLTANTTQIQTNSVAAYTIKITPPDAGLSWEMVNYNLLTGATMHAILFDGTTNSFAINATTGKLGNTGQELIVHTLGSNALTISASLGIDGGQFTKAGSGTLILSGNNSNVASLTGQFNINQGTLQAGSTTAFSPYSAMNIGQGGTLVLSGNSNSVNYLAGTGNITNGSATPATLTLQWPVQTNTTTYSDSSNVQPFNGLITDGGGALSLTKAGSRWVALLNPVNATTGNLTGLASTFTGNVNILEGYLSTNVLTDAGVPGAFGAGNTINLSTTTGSREGILLYTGTNGATNRAINIAGGALGGVSLTTAYASAASTLFGATLTLSGNIAGAGGLDKLENGNVILTGANTYSGGTLVRLGVLQFANTNALPSSGKIALVNGGVVSPAWALDQTFLNRLDTASVGVVGLGGSSAAALDFTNYPNVSLGANNQPQSFAGTITGNNSTIRLGGGGVSSAVTLQNPNILNGGNQVIISNVGTPGATVVYADTQGYTGNTTLTMTPDMYAWSGRDATGVPARPPVVLVLAGQNAAIPNSPFINLGAATTLRLVDTIAAAQKVTGNVNLYGATIDYRNDSSAANFAQTLGSAVNLNQGSNFVAVAASAGPIAALTLPGLTRTAGATIDFNTATTYSLNQQIKITGSPALGAWATIGGGIGGFAAYDLTNPTNVIKAAETAVTDFTSIVAGTNYTIGAAVASGFGSKSANTIRTTNGASDTVSMASGDTLTTNAVMVGANNGGLVLGNTAGTGTLTTSGSELFFYTHNNVGSITVNANINAPSATLVKSGTQTLTLAGSGTNSYAGLVINQAGVSISNLAALPTTANITLNGNGAALWGAVAGTYGSSSATMNVNADSFIGFTTGTVNVAYPISLNNGASLMLQNSGPGNVTYNGNITGTGGLMFGRGVGNAAYWVILAGNNNYTGLTQFLGANDGNNSGAYGQYSLASPVGNAVVGDILLGRRVLGASTTRELPELLRLNALDTLSGPNLDQIKDTSIMTFVGGSGHDAGAFQLYGYNETIGAIQSQGRGDGAIECVTGNITLRPISTLTMNATSGTYDFSGWIRDGSSGKMALNIAMGSGATQIISGTSTYTGNTILTSGTLGVGTDAALSTGNLVISGGKIYASSISGVPETLRTVSNNMTWSGSFEVGGAMDIKFPGTASLTANRTVTVSNSGRTEFSGVISGAGSSLTMNGTGGGIQVLSGPNTFDGGITIGGGVLLINNTTGSGSGSGSIVVNSGSTLGGVGIIGPGGSSNVSLLSGATLSPGDPNTAGGVGILSMNFSGSGQLLDLQAGSTLVYQLGSDSPGSYDQIALTGGGLNLNGQQWSDFQFTALGGFNPNGIYTLISSTTPISGALGAVTSGTINGYTMVLNAVDGTGLVLTQVPEPGTLALLAFGSLAVLHRRKKKAA